MAVNPELRREIADRIASWMRGEVTSDEHFTWCKRYSVSNNAALDKDPTANSVLWAGISRSAGSKWAVDRDPWAATRRELAFLEAGLEEPPAEEIDSPRVPPASLPGILLLVLVGLVEVCLVASLVVGWGWWGLIGWVAAPIAALGLMDLRRALLAGRRLPQLPRFDPFPNEAAWLACEPLLDRFTLPSDNHGFPVPLSVGRGCPGRRSRGSRPCAVGVLRKTAAVTLLVPPGVAILALGLLTWPIVLAGVWLSSRRRRRVEQWAAAGRIG